jgi:hypothetical protein
MWVSELSVGRSLRIAAVLMVTFASAVLYAQVDTASIIGTVKDSSGALIQSASVTVQNVATGESQTAKVSAAGTYVFPYLRVGNYTVSAEAGGFKKEIRDGSSSTSRTVSRWISPCKSVPTARRSRSQTALPCYKPRTPMLELSSIRNRLRICP